jgi:Pretoxin HINT domain
MRWFALWTLALITFQPACAADPPTQRIDLNSESLGVLGLPLIETEKPVRRITLTADLTNNEDGKGTIVLDVTEPPTYDEFGFVKTPAPVHEISLDCTVKFVKTTTKVYTARVGGPGSDKYEEQRDKWNLYSITGPKIKSQMFLVLPSQATWPWGRLLLQGPDGTVKHVIGMTLPPQPEPCHPGCFPPGTQVRTPGGTTIIEQLQEGDKVTTVATDGRTTTATVEAVFVTRNRILEVHTADGTLVTTETQPLALEEGGFRSAGKLKAGDRVWRWNGRERRATTISEVSTADRQSKVFNLVLGSPTTFIAGDFLVRSKPPSDVALP